MWMSGWNKLRKLAEEHEELRRTVEGIRYDMEDLKARLQRMLWRVGKLSAPVADGADAGAGAATNTVAPAPRTSTATPAVAGVDPVSAALLARRSRGPIPNRTSLQEDAPAPRPDGGSRGDEC